MQKSSNILIRIEDILGLYKGQTIVDPLLELYAHGLWVIPLDSGRLQWYIKQIREGKPLERVFYCEISPPQQRVILRHNGNNTEYMWKRIGKALSVSWLMNDTWELSIIEGHGGFHSDDFICILPSIDAVVSAALNYYFGAATRIQEWIVPLNKHPELNKEDVERAISQAQHISSAEFEQLRTYYRTETTQQAFKNGWEEALFKQFIELKPIRSVKYRCFLRRNAKDVYIIPIDEVRS